MMIYINETFNGDDSTTIRVEGRLDINSVAVLEKVCQRHLVRNRKVYVDVDGLSHISREAREFLSAFHVESSLIGRVIKSSLSASDLISFFTVEGNEARSWTIAKGTSALDAADHIHSDMKTGFIRAEVLPYNDFAKYESISEARKCGHLRLEGKEYIVQDGDIIKFRFNV